jgi:hypothetical protein
LDENERHLNNIEGKKTKKQKLLRNHILIFKNPMELLDNNKPAEKESESPTRNLDSPLMTMKV